MSSQNNPCGKATVYPLTNKIIKCTLTNGHPHGMHHHQQPPELMWWPVDEENVVCAAYKVSSTAMGPVVLRCAIPRGQHKPLTHESRVGIQRVGWDDSQINAAGKAAKAMLELFAERRYESGDRLPGPHELGQKLGYAPPTIVTAFDMLARDGVTVRAGRTVWRKI